MEEDDERRLLCDVSTLGPAVAAAAGTDGPMAVQQLLGGAASELEESGGQDELHGDSCTGQEEVAGGTAHNDGVAGMGAHGKDTSSGC